MRALTPTILCALAATAAMACGASAGAADWPSFRGDPALAGVAPPPEKMAARPRQVWAFESGADAVESTAAISGGLVFVGTAGGELLVIDLASGKERFRHRLATSSGIRSSPAVAGRRIYFGDDGGVFHALELHPDRRELKEVWSFATEGEIVSSPTLAGDRLLFGSYDSHLYCLSIDGKLLWKLPTEGQVHATPAVSEGAALIAGCDGQLRAVDLEGGKEVGRVDMGGYSAASPAARGSRAFVGTYSNNVIAVDWRMGTVLWTYEHPQRQFPFHASPALAGDKVIVAGRDKLVRALDAKTGKPGWEFPTRARVDSSPVVCGGAVFVGSSDGELYLLDLGTGEKRWSFVAGAPITASPAIGGGWLVIGTGDGRILGFDLQAKGETKTLEPLPPGKKSS